MQTLSIILIIAYKKTKKSKNQLIYNHLKHLKQYLYIINN